MANTTNDDRFFIVFGSKNTFSYLSHRGTTETRTVIPHSLRFGVTEYHPDPQWLLECFCCDRQALRTFALADITMLNY